MAAAVLLVAFVTVVTGCVLVTGACLRVMRRRQERRKWDDLVARHQELDRELEDIWQHR